MEKTLLENRNNCPTWLVNTGVTDLYVSNIYGYLNAWTPSKMNDGSISSGMFIHEAKEKDADFEAFIADCLKIVNTCPECGNYCPISEQMLVGFANRACPECYPKLKAEIEKPGWTM